MRSWSRWILGVLVLLLAACGDDASVATGLAMENAEVEQATPRDDDANQPPEIEQLVLRPQRPRPGERIRAEVRASDPDGDAVHLSYAWRVDGQRVGDGPVLHTQGHPKGTLIELRVEIHDGQIEGRAQSASVRVGNQPPVMLGVVIEPLGLVTVQNDIGARPQASDPDGDALEFRYAWTINGRATYANRGGILPKEEFARGDRIAVRVTAHDGSESSQPLQSQPFEVENAPPAITSTPGGFDETGRFRYQVVASDPDGDRGLRYHLVESPAGMSLDLQDGMLSWTPTESQKGEHPVAIEVEDRAGGKATQRFTLGVDFADAAPASQAD